MGTSRTGCPTALRSRTRSTALKPPTDAASRSRTRTGPTCMSSASPPQARGIPAPRSRNRRPRCRPSSAGTARSSCSSDREPAQGGTWLPRTRRRARSARLWRPTGSSTARTANAVTSFVRAAEWSADGHWVAFEVSYGSLDGPPIGPCGPTIGALGQERGRCSTAADDAVRRTAAGVRDATRGALGVVARRCSARLCAGRRRDDELFVIDPSDGSRTSLGTVDWTRDRLEWSPDGTRIAYSDGGSVYQVGGGRREAVAACGLVRRHHRDRLVA